MTRKRTRKKSAVRRAARARRRWRSIALATLALAAIAATFLALNGYSSGTGATEISAAEAYEKYQQGAFFLDVRSEAEWNAYHVPGSVLIPLEELAQRLSEMPRDREIVVICGLGNRSKEGRDILIGAGFENVFCVTGGLEQWRARGYPTEP